MEIQMEKIMEMAMEDYIENTWLIQRLNKPLQKGVIDWGSFGGGLRNGGLTKEKANEISKICRFDYMGAAEFEFGALPKALKAMSEENLVVDFLPVKIHSLNGWELPSETRNKINLNKAISADIYFLCADYLREHAKELIRQLAKDDMMGNLKEFPRFRRGVVVEKNGAKEDKQDNTFGWLELDNGIVMSTDKNLVRAFERIINGG